VEWYLSLGREVEVRLPQVPDSAARWKYICNTFPLLILLIHVFSALPSPYFNSVGISQSDHRHTVCPLLTIHSLALERKLGTASQFIESDLIHAGSTVE
jgi:hypothetical protein